MKRKNYIRIIFICMTLLFTSGCWDIKDINDTAFVLSIGIDKSSSPNAKYLISFEFAKPVATSEHTLTEGMPASVEADSILQAIQRMQTSISRSISLSHLRLIVVGEEIAKEVTYQDFSNYFFREPASALQLRLVFVDGAHARDLFYTHQSFENRLAAEMVAMGELRKELPLVRTNNFLDFFSDLQRTNGTAIGGRVFINDKNFVIREGGAVYKDWKLHTWLTPDEAQAANWLIQNTQNVVVAQQGENLYTYDLDKHKTTIKPQYKSGALSFIVSVVTSGMVLEKFGEHIDLSKQENLVKLENLFAETIKQQIQLAIQKSQKEIQADYLGFDKSFEKYNVKDYRKLNWEEIYPTIPIEVQVTCNIKGYGLRK